MVQVAPLPAPLIADGAIDPITAIVRAMTSYPPPYFDHSADFIARRSPLTNWWIRWIWRICSWSMPHFAMGGDLSVKDTTNHCTRQSKRQSFAISSTAFSVQVRSRYATWTSSCSRILPMSS
jgi:hypothetical protein